MAGDEAEPSITDDLPPGFLELFKLAVEMADRVSARRATANSFFLAVNTGLAAFVGSQDLRWYVAAAGILFAAVWWALLKSYRDLNDAKFQVILEMEKRLPVPVFGDEWQRLKRDPVKFALKPQSLRGWASRYRELGQVERVVPWVFALIYLAEIVRRVLE